MVDLTSVLTRPFLSGSTPLGCLWDSTMQCGLIFILIVLSTALNHNFVPLCAVILVSWNTGFDNY